jgi:hypothetical protein
VTVEPQKVLIDDRAVLVVRLTGTPRDPDSGRHRRIVVFVSPTLGLDDLARRLHIAADWVDHLKRQP